MISMHSLLNLCSQTSAKTLHDTFIQTVINIIGSFSKIKHIFKTLLECVLILLYSKKYSDKFFWRVNKII